MDRLEGGVGVSPALADAQLRLESLRLAHRLKQNQEQPSNAISHGRFFPNPPKQSTDQQPAYLPPHLGWVSVPFTRAYHLVQKRQQNEQARRQVNRGTAKWLPGVPASHLPPPQTRTVSVAEEQLKLSPDIALAILRNKLASSGRIWLLLRFLDHEGSGWVSGEEARRQLCQKSSPLYVCGRRQLRNLLASGEGTFWQQSGERIWLISTARVAAKLGLSRLNARPVRLPLSVLLNSIGTVRAHLYASFHSSRTRQLPHLEEAQASPISRNTLKKLSAAARRTQMLYEKRAGVRQEPNFAVGKHHTLEEEQNAAWQHGRATFQFHDHKGHLGEGDQTYVAWQLPNSYYGPHEVQPDSSRKRINRQLADLFNEGITGNGKNMIDPVCEAPQARHLYYQNGAMAAKVYNRSPQQDILWQSRQTRSGRYRLWHHLPALDRKNQ